MGRVRGDTILGGHTVRFSLFNFFLSKKRQLWGGRQEGGSGWGTHANPWLIHVNAWQKPLQYCKVISLQLIKINGKKIKKSIG